MLRYVSTKGGISPVDFETAVLQGFADDGGLFVPEKIPQLSINQLQEWSTLSFNDLAFEILSLFIDQSIIPAVDLQTLIGKSTQTFSHPDIIPVIPLGKDSKQFVMELFQGPTLSFKDVAMGFLVNTIDYFLDRKGERISLLVATTGDTGPAAAHASCGKKTIDCWTLFPRGFISEEQERQMTTLEASNVHAVSVENCQDSADDLDLVIAQMFEDKELVKKLRLSSVNSINWCRVMFQAIHYFYGYFRTVDTVGERIVYSVPTGAFGNLFAGYLAREMGLPVDSFICANNSNGVIHRVHETDHFSRESLKQTVSSAIDIALPYNYWRFLYFVSGHDSEKVRNWIKNYQEQGSIQFDKPMMDQIKKGFLSAAISDEKTLSTISETYQMFNGYLLDPHGAVAVAAANELKSDLDPNIKIICLATAHPAKFPEITRRALNLNDGPLPKNGMHDSIESAKNRFHHVRICDCSQLKTALEQGMLSVTEKSDHIQ